MFQNLLHQEAADLLVASECNTLWSSCPQNFLFVKRVQYRWCPDWTCFLFSFQSISSTSFSVLFGNRFSQALGCNIVESVIRLSQVQDPRATCHADSWRWLYLHFHSKFWGRLFQVPHFDIPVYFTCHAVPLVLFRNPDQSTAVGIWSVVVVITGCWRRCCKVS